MVERKRWPKSQQLPLFDHRGTRTRVVRTCRRRIDRSERDQNAKPTDTWIAPVASSPSGSGLSAPSTRTGPIGSR